jgi:exodeoxyribonuclease VII large subunit
VVTIIKRRAPGVDIALSPATVQGEPAVDAVVTAVERAGRVNGADLVLVVRGGGSLEDLMAFNHERVARAIRACPLPVITGIGHQTDLTIADLVADQHAATPSAAAELAVPMAAQIRSHVSSQSLRLLQAVRQELLHKRRALDRDLHRLERQSPARSIPNRRQEVDRHVAALGSALLLSLGKKRRGLDGAYTRLQLTSPAQRLPVLGEGIARRRERLAAATQQKTAVARALVVARTEKLEALSPRRVLERGFSITTSASGEVVKDASQLKAGDRLRTTLAKGVVESQVDKVQTED